MDLGIKEEIALVVGASEGIGYESAKALLEEGAEVLICSRNAGKLKRAAQQLEQASGRKVRWFAADVMDSRFHGNDIDLLRLLANYAKLDRTLNLEHLLIRGLPCPSSTRWCTLTTSVPRT